MARYIDEENLIRRMHTMAKDKNYPPYADIFKSFAFKAFKDLLMSEPTADVQEVKHGKWVKSETDRHYCSICHEVRPYYFKETLVNRYVEKKMLSLINWECLYCPNCGAKMDGKEQIKK